MLTHGTPIEHHEIAGRLVLVKREDLCCPFPGPSFSKMRGVLAHIANRPEKTIGVLDTFHSKAGWAVSWACQQLGKQAVDFWPRYKADGAADLPRPQQRQARDLGALMRDLPAGRSAVLYHGARKRLAAEFPGAYLMPNALKLPESITENAAEALRTFTGCNLGPRGTMVLSVSSGTVAAGVIAGALASGFADHWSFILHMGYSRSIPTMRTYMERVSGLDLSDTDRFVFIDEGYDYADRAPTNVGVPPFCNPHYDAKAWAWLASTEIAYRIAPLGDPILFWNIGD